MGAFRFLFAPDLVRPLAETVRRSAGPALAAASAWRVSAGGSQRAGRWPSSSGVAVWVALAGLGVAGITALSFGGAAEAQGIAPGLFAEVDGATRDALGFLGDLRAGRRTALGGMLFAFNAGVLALAGFLLIWHTAAGILDTAREGRFGFGIWEIVRIVAAVALMAPLPGGLNGAQHAVIGLAHLGGDFANAVWEPFSAEALGAGEPVAPRPREALWRAAIARAVILETCRHAANAAAARAGDDPYVRLREARDGGTTVLHYDGAGRGMPGDLCGSLRFVGLDAEGARGIAAAGHRDALAGLLPDIRAIGADLASRYVSGSPAYGRPLPEIDGLLDAKDLAGRYAGALDAALERAASEERAAIADAVTRDASAAGWMSAASFFNTIAHRTGLFQAAAHNVPGVALPPPSLGKWAPAADAAVRGVGVALARSRGYRPLLHSAADGSTGALPAPAGPGGSDAGQGIIEFIDLHSVTIADSGNPIADLSALGHSLISAALGAMAALMGAGAGSGLLESVPFIGRGLDVFESVWRVADGVVSAVLGMLLVAGAVLAYLLPALPFIRFLFAIVGWIVTVAAAVFAVTVFAAAHVTRGDGNRLATGATRLGWLFLPGLVLRPALMLFGLIAGYFVFLAGLGLFNEAWLPQMRDAAGSGGLGPVGFLAMLGLYVIIAYGLMNASFKLIDLLPSAVLEWIGGRGGASDEGSERVGGAALAAASSLGRMRLGGRFAGR